MTWKVYRFVRVHPIEVIAWATENQVPKLMSSWNRCKGSMSAFTICMFENEPLIQLTWSEHLEDK